MDKLTAEQKASVVKFLTAQGLSFKPLRDEMVDHITVDLEDRMAGGSSFEDAWQQCVETIPEHHFQNIQKEIMETINKRFTRSQLFSMIALGLLLISTTFKVLHLQFSEEVLLLSFAFIAASLLTSTITGISLNKEKKGITRLLTIVVGIIILIVGFSFKLLHLPGADGVVILAVVCLIVGLLLNTQYVYVHASGEGNLLTMLHEKYTPGIERFLLFLLIPLLIYKVVTLVSSQDTYVGNFILLVVIFGAGLQLVALSWRSMEHDLSTRNPFTLYATIVSSLCLSIVFLGPVLPFELRVVLIAIYSSVSAWLAHRLEDKTKEPVSIILSILVPVIFIGWTLIKLDVLSSSAHAVFFNLPILVVLVVGLFLCRKHGSMRAYMLISVSSYVFEYMV